MEEEQTTNRGRIYILILLAIIIVIVLALVFFWAVPKYNLAQYNKGYSVGYVNGGLDLIIKQSQNAVCLVTNGTDVISIPLK